jgi:GntR family transcriptional regulator
VNPNTIARTYTELERDGVLHTRQGLGVFVAEPSNDLTRAARKKKIVDLIDSLLTEAVYLGFASSEVIAAVTERTRQFDWQPAAAGGAKS